MPRKKAPVEPEIPSGPSDADKLAALVSVLVEKAAAGEAGPEAEEALKLARAALEVHKRMEQQNTHTVKIEVPAPVQAAICRMVDYGGEIGPDQKEFAGGSRLLKRFKESGKRQARDK